MHTLLRVLNTFLIAGILAVLVLIFLHIQKPIVVEIDNTPLSVEIDNTPLSVEVDNVPSVQIER